MKYFIWIISLLLITSFYQPIFAWDETEVKPKFYDSNPNDGFMDPGSSINPYIIRDSQGNESEMKPKYYDANPHDGYNDPGSSVNPYVIKPMR